MIGDRLLWRDATVARIEPRTARVVSVFLTPPFERHLAGQHLAVRLTAEDGYSAQRDYSIASAPGGPEIELAVERMGDGEVSPYFHEIAQVGDAIEIRGPIGGHFVWRPEASAPVLLLGGGSGVAPLMSMVRQHAQAASAAPMLLVYSSRTFEDVIFRDELIALDERRAGFSLALATTRGPKHREGDLDRRLDAAALGALLSRWGADPAATYVCGSNAFVEGAVRALLAHGTAAETIRTERFGGAV
jgi:ferredoxin-NADP reductase